MEEGQEDSFQKLYGVTENEFITVVDRAKQIGILSNTHPVVKASEIAKIAPKGTMENGGNPYKLGFARLKTLVNDE